MSDVKSCEGCPSYVPAEDVSSVFRKDSGAAMCRRFGHMLEKPGAPEAVQVRIKQKFAEPCDAYGQPAESTANFSAQVCNPDVQVIMRGPVDRMLHNIPSSCTACVNFIPAQVVKKELGWALGACAATGRLLFPAEYRNEASQCIFGQIGAQRDSTDGMALKPVYENAFATVSVHASTSVRRIEDIEDPRTYETDEPVEEIDRAIGIRAWRHIPDPEGLHGPARLPIFESDPERGLVGADYDAFVRQSFGQMKPELYLDHAGILYDVLFESENLDETVALIGPAGVGKSEFAAYLAWNMNVPLTRITIDRSTEKLDLIGQPALVDGNTTWLDGRLTKGWKQNGVLLIDEPNLGQDEVLQTLRPLTDNAKQLALDVKGGEDVVVERAPWCVLLLAMNPAWDPSFVGANVMSTADSERLSTVWVDYPEEDIERQIIRERCLADGYEIASDTLDAIMSSAKELRGLIKEGALPVGFGVRSTVKVARKTAGYSITKAFRRAFVDGLEPELQELVMRTVTSFAVS